MNTGKKFQELNLELVETTRTDLRQVMENNDTAISALSAFAQPVHPLELVRPPKPVATTIKFETYPEPPTAEEICAAQRSKTAHTITWFDLVALFSVTGIAIAKLGVLDLARLWT